MEAEHETHVVLGDMREDRVPRLGASHVDVRLGAGLEVNRSAESGIASRIMVLWF